MLEELLAYVSQRWETYNLGCEFSKASVNYSMRLDRYLPGVSVSFSVKAKTKCLIAGSMGTSIEEAHRLLIHYIYQMDIRGELFEDYNELP